MDAPGTAGSLHVSEHSLVSQNGHREPRASRRKGPNPSSWAWGRPRWPGQLLPEQECLGVGGTPWVPTGHQLTTGRGRARVQARLVRKATEPASWPQRPWAPRLLSGKGLRSLPQWGSPAQLAGSVRGGAFCEGRGLPGGGGAFQEGWLTQLLAGAAPQSKRAAPLPDSPPHPWREHCTHRVRPGAHGVLSPSPSGGLPTHNDDRQAKSWAGSPGTAGGRQGPWPRDPTLVPHWKSRVGAGVTSTRIVLGSLPRDPAHPLAPARAF